VNLLFVVCELFFVKRENNFGSFVEFCRVLVSVLVFVALFLLALRFFLLAEWFECLFK